MDEEGFWVYGALYRTFGAPDMASCDLILNESHATNGGSHFCPCICPGMDSGGAATAIGIAGGMMHHTLFDVADPFLCISSG